MECLTWFRTLCVRVDDFQEEDPVTGQIVVEVQDCEKCRSPKGDCGPEGKFWKGRVGFWGRVLNFFKGEGK
jgi:hypothetical protein